jgi:alkanesulfonate monooxygenase SsuD/methylene tetrahydromethanopterin reductase-like flavin-dependent oxidoreductase (luciferase family)
MAMSEFKFGVLLRSQFPRDQDLTACFQDVCAMARLVDALGFDSLVKGSHYGATGLADFQQVPFLARIMTEAPRCRLVAGVSLLALHKPLDIAEQFATLDVMSGGRAVLGAALGYREEEFRAFGTTQSERVRRLEENLVAVRRLWTEPTVSMTASHFELMDVGMGMPPVQTPHPPIWIGANADPAIRRAARLGDCWYAPPHNRIESLLRQLDVYRRELDAVGKPFPQEFPVRREVFVAPTREEALRRCLPALKLKYETYVQWGQNAPMPQGDSLDVAIDELIEDRFIIGTPDEVSEQIVAFCGAMQSRYLVISPHGPGMEPEVAMDCMRLFAEEVMPRVRRG